MNDPWYVILRDLMVIIAAAAVLLSAVLSTLIAWRLYKVGREVKAQLGPIVASLSETADTVKTSGSFVAERRVPSPIAALGVAAGTYQLYHMVRQFGRGLGDAPPGDAPPGGATGVDVSVADAAAPADAASADGDGDRAPALARERGVRVLRGRFRVPGRRRRDKGGK